MLVSNKSNRLKRRIIQKWQIVCVAVAINCTALLFRGDFYRAADAAILYSKFTSYIQDRAKTFLTAANISALEPMVTAFLELIPWAIILLAGGVITWQAYSGYQAYERDDLSGAGKCVLNMILMLLLLVMSSAITDFMVGSTPTAG